MFRHYLYASSASAPLLPHFDAYADEVVRRFAPSGSLVVEVGSNDGVLLRPLAARGARVLGVEPSTNIAAVANAADLETWNDFFTTDVARRVVAEKGPASAVLANNVLAHIDDLHDVVASLDILLADTGVFVTEFPYLLDLMEHVEYDTIYHEHLSYLALAPLARLFAEVGLELFDVHHLDVHGGSLRLFVGRAGRHEITLSVDGTAVLLVRLRVAGGTEETRMVSLTPVETMRTELLSEGEKTIPYHALSSGHPLRLRVIGPADVDLSSRLDFDATMRGTVGYRIEVSEAGRKVREYAFKTTKATTASYTNMRDVVPSKLDHFVIPVGAGTHELVFTLLEPAHATAVLHARIPAPTVGNEE